MGEDSLPEKFLRHLKDFLGDAPAAPRRITELPFALHLLSGTGSVELFPAGPLDPFSFHQRHHASVHHDLEYVVARSPGRDDFTPYAVLRIRPEHRVPLVDLHDVERALRRSYGTLIHLPRARPLLERQYSEDLNDEDPPEGLNRIRVPDARHATRGNFSVAEVLDIMRAELSGPEVISWLEGAYRQPPRKGRAEHRYYLDTSGRLYAVCDHFEKGKALYRAETSAAAGKPVRRSR